MSPGRRVNKSLFDSWREQHRKVGEASRVNPLRKTSLYDDRLEGVEVDYEGSKSIVGANIY